MARPSEADSFRSLRNRKRELRNLIDSAKRNGLNVTLYESEMKEINTKIEGKAAKALRNSAEEVSFSEHNSNETTDMDTNSTENPNVTTENNTESQPLQHESNEMQPPVSEIVKETPQAEPAPVEKQEDLLAQMEAMAQKRVSDIKADTQAPKEVILDAPKDEGNAFFEPVANEKATDEAPTVESDIPGESTTSDNIIELFLDNELVSDILIEGTETLFVEWFPTLYISTKFTKEEQKILISLQFRAEKNKNKWVETIEEDEFEVLQKYLLLEEYKKRLPYTKAERNNLQKCVEQLLKKKAIKVTPEMGLIVTLTMAFGKRTFPIVDEKIADVVSTATNRLFDWLERITDKAETKRNNTENGTGE